MKRQGRILVIDDLATWREELVEILTLEGYAATAEASTAQVLRRLQETFYHVFILDLRLDEADLTNVDGVELLSTLEKLGLDEAIKVIMLSGHGTPQHMRTAFREYKVADFLNKGDFKKSEFLEIVQSVFAKDVQINLHLDINWQQISGPEQAVLRLEIDGQMIEADSPFQARLSTELDDLLRRLFHQADGILVKPLPTGYSGTGLLWVQPFYPTGAGEATVVKFGQYRKIEIEYRNFNTYIKPFVGGGHTTTIVTMRRTVHLGGIVYSLLGVSDDSWEDFGSYYQKTEVAQIKQTLDHLFCQTCKTWYASSGRLQLHNLTADYLNLFNLSLEKLELEILTYLPAVHATQEQLRFDALGRERTWKNPFHLMKGKNLACATYECTTHGDLNQHNILVDSTGSLWLIDFQSAGQGHILRDVSMLDSVVRFQLLAQEEATLEERLAMEEVLCSSTRFDDVYDLENRFQTDNPALAKAYAVVVHLRKQARRLVAQNPGSNISEYGVALLYNALNTLQFYSLPMGQREHALLSASLLAKRLCP